MKCSSLVGLEHFTNYIISPTKTTLVYFKIRGTKMKLDILELDEIHNSIIREAKISHSHDENTIYKNSNRYKHNDIIYIPCFDEIQKYIHSSSIPENT